MQVRCPVLVGRRAESGMLAEAVDAVRRGSGRALFIGGEAGVGKSRLVREATAPARLRGLPVVVGRCVEAGTPAPLRPWMEAVLSLTRTHRLPEREALGAYAAVLSRLVPEWGPPAAHPGEAVGPLLGEALLRMLRAMVPRGCVVVLEDLHWADPETLAVLEYVCDHVADVAVLLAVTVRDGERGQAWAVADALTARGSAQRMMLAPLGSADVAAMVRACGVEDTDDLATAAEGLPLLVEELLGDRDVQVPRSLLGSVERRAAQLGTVGSRVLLAAAVLGRRFDWRLVAEVAAGGGTEVFADAVRAGLLVADGDGYRFRHALTREAVLAAGTGPGRAELAAQLGAALRRRHPDLPGPMAVLAADLAERAGDAGAADLLATAGRRSARDGALGSAAALLERGIALARSAEQRVELADALAEVRCRAGRLDVAAAATRDLVALLRDVDPAGQVAVRRRAHIRLARTYAEAARWTDAETELAVVADPTEQGLFEVDLVRALILLGRHAEAEAAHVAGTVVEPALAADRPDLACEALLVVGRAARGRDTDGAVAAFERALTVAMRHDLPLAELSALHELGTIDMFSTGRRDRLLAARAGAEAAGAVRLTAVLDLQLVAAHHMHGDGTRAASAARRALDGATTLGIAPMRVIALALIACPAALTADRDAVEAAIAAIPPGALDSDPDSWSSIWGTSRATCSLLREDRPAAVREVEAAAAAIDGAVEIRPQTWWGFWVLLRAVDDRDAEAAIAALRACPAVVNRQNLAYAELAEAVLAGRRGDAEHATATVARWDASALPWAWLRHLGRRLVAEAALADGWGEPRVWLAEAAAFFDGFGTPAVARECRRLIAGAAAMSEELRRRGVTPREAEVLALLGQGVTGTRELAARLVISPRTVEKHVEALCRKLDVRARSQLAALAARTGSPAAGQVQAMT